jgi:hypothetical protein
LENCFEEVNLGSKSFQKGEGKKNLQHFKLLNVYRTLTVKVIDCSLEAYLLCNYYLDLKIYFCYTGGRIVNHDG